MFPWQWKHTMLRRWKKRVAPVQQEEEYIQRRYEDTSVRIMKDIKLGRGLYNSYVPWLQEKLLYYIQHDDHTRLKHWLDQVPLYTSQRTWIGEQVLLTPSHQSIPLNEGMSHGKKETVNQRNVQSSVCIIL